jgi:hypothetical protein
VIRRAFWLSVGAAAGIAGYRRASAVGRAVQVHISGATQPSATQPSATPRGATPPSATPALAASPGPGPFWPPRAVESAPPGVPQTRFTEGRAPSSPVTRGPAVPVPWSATRTAWRTSRAAWKAQKAAVSGVRSAGRFARDVREGMDVYMSRQDD